MADSHSVSRAIPRAVEGDDQAVAILWEKYFPQLVRYARRKLDGVPQRAADEEDVALSAMYSFCRGLEAGRFTQIDDRHDLWKILVTITARKACAQRRHEFAQRRGAGRVRGESIFLRIHSDEGRAGGLEAAIPDPSPEMADDVVRTCHHMLDELDETNRQIALWLLEGCSQTEIAERLGVVRETVNRKIRRIKEKWTRYGLVSAES